MPAAIAVPAIVGAIGVGASVYGTNRQSSATRRAASIQDRANRDAMQFERDAEARRRVEFDQIQARAKEQWDAEQVEVKRQADEEQRRFELTRQTDLEDRIASRAERERAAMTDKERYDFEQSRREPYRAAGHAAVGALSQKAGLAAPPPRAEFRPSPAQPPLPMPTAGTYTPTMAPQTAPPMLSQPQQPDDGRMLTQGEVADLTPEKLEELIKHGFRLPPMGSLVGQPRQGVSSAY